MTGLVFGVLALGCGGILTEPEVEIPIVVTNPDGSTQVITRGADLAYPVDFPLPKPPGLTPQSSIASGDGGPTTVTYLLESKGMTLEVYTFYAEWLEAEGHEFEVRSTNLAGMKMTAFETDIDGSRVSISLMEGMGSRMLTLMVQPR